MDGTYAFATNGYGMPPYGEMLNNQSAAFHCAELTHDITGGMGWNVTITSLAGSNFLATQLGNQTTYEE